MNRKKLEELARREIKRMKKVFKNLKLKNEKGSGILELARSYLEDASYFLKQKEYLIAFEAAVISWAYIDAGLHIGLFEVDEKVRKYFTVEY